MFAIGGHKFKSFSATATFSTFYIDLLCLLLVTMFCACFGRKRKSSEIPPDVTPKDVQQSSCETTIHHPITQVEETRVPSPVLENGGTPNKVLTLNGRKLPDIPHYEDLGRNWDPDTSLDITRPHSQNAVEKRLLRTGSISKNAPNSQSSPDLHVYELEEPLASVSLPKLDTPSSSNNVPPNSEEYESNDAIRPHPYETLLGQTVDENYYEPRMYSMPTPRERNTPFSPAWYQSDSGTREALPPLVPAKNFSEDELYESTNEPSSSSAATAVAGRHFPDIPFMTSPERNSQEESNFEDLNESASSKQVISYTSISVREPIKTVLANSAAKAVPKPRARKITEEQEAVYSTVSEDADTDQTYEVIESARSSAHLNDMYAQVSKPVTTVDETREPPEPPTLESLKNVAHAHSRQTSSSSIKNLTHGQQLAVGGADHYADTYGSRELHPYTETKKARNTVHVMDTDPLAGMYAKIQKKKGSSSRGHSPTNRASSVVIQTQPLPQEPAEPSTSRVVFRRESSTVDPGYEMINGGCQDPAARPDEDTGDGIVGYESIRGSSRNDDGGVSSSDDPGYARVDVDNGSEILDPTYECLTARRSSPGSSDPGYWKIRSPEEDLGDHLYELISSRKKEEEEEEEEEEPNYDRIRSPAGNDTDEDEEPAYEKVHQKPLPESDPGADSDQVLLDDELVKDVGDGGESEEEDRSVNLTSKGEED